MTKQEILASLSAKDKNTLEKLLNYSELFLLPEEDLLTSVTASQLVTKAHSLADVYFPEWTDRTKSDFGEFLVELFANFSEKDFWYINNFRLESFLPKMAIYSNAWYRAVELGYIAELHTSASCKMQLQFSSGAEEIFEIGEIILSRSGDTISISNTQRIIVPTSGVTTYITASFSQGKYETVKQAFNGRSFKLTKKGICLSSLILKVADIPWDMQNTFSTSSSTDMTFIAVPELDAKAEIYFGDNIFGSRPSVGSELEAKYLVSEGSLSNRDTLGSYTVQSGSARLIATTALTLLSGGLAQASLEQVKSGAELLFRTQSRIVNSQDCIDILTARSDVFQAYSYVWADKVNFFIIPDSGMPATQAELDSLALEYSEIVIAGYFPQGLQTAYVSLANMDITAYVLTGANLSEVEVEIREVIEEYTNPNKLAKYGKNFTFLDFINHVVSNIQSVQNIVINSIAGNPPAFYPGGEITVGLGGITSAIIVTGAQVITNGVGIIPSLTVSQGELTISVTYLS